MMATKNSADVKFSMVEDEEIYNELERFVLWMANRNGSDVDVLMESDELVGELLLEMAKGLRTYSHLPKDQKKAVIRKMMDNRISEIRHRVFGTHRRLGLSPIRLDQETDLADATGIQDGAYRQHGHFVVEELVEEEGSDPYESIENVSLTRQLLSENAKKVFDAVIYGNERLGNLARLSGKRHEAVFGTDRVRIKTWQIADSLLMEPRQVRRAIREIRRAYSEVCNA